MIVFVLVVSSCLICVVLSDLALPSLALPRPWSFAVRNEVVRRETLDIWVDVLCAVNPNPEPNPNPNTYPYRNQLSFSSLSLSLSFSLANAVWNLP